MAVVDVKLRWWVHCVGCDEYFFAVLWSGTRAWQRANTPLKRRSTFTCPRCGRTSGFASRHDRVKVFVNGRGGS